MESLAEWEILKDIPGYTMILKSVLKQQIQNLVEQLASKTGEESVILTASVTDGSLSHLGSESGKIFLQDHDDIKSQFLGFCLKRFHSTKQTDKGREKSTSSYRLSQSRNWNKPRTTSASASDALSQQSQTSFNQNIVSSSDSVNQNTDSSSDSIHPVALIHTSNTVNKTVSKGPSPENFLKKRKRSVDEKNNDNKLYSAEGPTSPSHPKDTNVLVKMEQTLDNQTFGETDQITEGLCRTNQEVESYQELSSSLQTGTAEHILTDCVSVLLNQNAASTQQSDTQSAGSSLVPNVIVKQEKAEMEAALEITAVEPSKCSLVDTPWTPEVQSGAEYNAVIPVHVPTSQSYTESQGNKKYNEKNAVEDTAANSPNVKVKRSVFKCEMCFYESYYKQNWRRHVNNHKRVNNASSAAEDPGSKQQPLFVCEWCTTTFKTKHGLKLHTRTKHLKEFRFLCSVCGAGFNVLSAFRGHLASHHKKLKEKCSLCAATFQYKKSLIKHVQRIHEGVEEKTFYCNECKISFSGRDTLLQHIRGKHGGKGFECKFCAKVFRWRSSLAYHNSKPCVEQNPFPSSP